MMAKMRGEGSAGGAHYLPLQFVRQPYLKLARTRSSFLGVHSIV